jgi:hypothetical protein
MESKIEKIEIVIGKEMCIEEEIQNLYENYMELVGKINQIIDHLNSQSRQEEKEEWKKRFIRTFGYWGEEIKFIQQLLDEREREAKIEVLTEIFQTCYQEDSKTRELVEEKLSKLKDKK